MKSTDQIGGNLNLRVNAFLAGRNINPDPDAKGNEKQHDLQLRVQGEPVSGQLHLTGSFDRKAERWKGTLDTRFNTPVGPLAVTLLPRLPQCRTKDQHWHTAGPTRMRSQCRRPSTRERKGARKITLNRFDLAIKPFTDTTQASGVFSVGRPMWPGTPPQRGLPQGSVTLWPQREGDTGCQQPRCRRWRLIP